MRPGQQNKRGRGRNGGGNNNRKGQNPLSRTYDSSGPDVKIRGTAQTVADKYMSLARDAQSSGDRVMAENYLQHAEHYNRIIAAAQAQIQERHQRDDRDQSRDDDNDDNDSNNNGNNDRASGNQASSRSDDSSGNSGEGSGDNGGGNSGGSRRQSRQRQERKPFDADSPQPVIEGVPAEVALDENPGEGDNAAAKPRRRGRPRRAKSGEGEDSGNASESSQAPEATAAE